MSRKKIGKGSAPAKIILFGEHFVVHGKPAILASIDKRIEAKARQIDKQITISSDIGGSARYSDGEIEIIRGDNNSRLFLDPIYRSIVSVIKRRKKEVGIKLDMKSEIPYGMGLGSSAASCVATVAAVDSLFHKPDKKWVCQNAIESERIIHQNSSGADCYVSAFGGMIYYSRSRGYKKINSKKKISFIVADTGVKHSTGALVASVTKFRDANSDLYESLALQAEKICNDAVVALRNADKQKIGHLMNENQKLLKTIGVSHEKIDKIIKLCIDSGALGAKLTGAGGGGAVIALASSIKDMKKIMSEIKKDGFDCFAANIDNKGLIVS